MMYFPTRMITRVAPTISLTRSNSSIFNILTRHWSHGRAYLQQNSEISSYTFPGFHPHQSPYRQNSDRFSQKTKSGSVFKGKWTGLIERDMLQKNSLGSFSRFHPARDNNPGIFEGKFYSACNKGCSTRVLRKCAEKFGGD